MGVVGVIGIIEVSWASWMDVMGASWQLTHLGVTAHPLKSICFASEGGCSDRLAWVTTTTRSDFTRVVMSKRYVMGGFLGDFALWDGCGDP